MRHVRAIRILGWLVAAPFIGGWLANDRAVASCGDYVTIGDQMHQDGAHQSARHESTSEPGVPQCTGPHCQRQVPAPGVPQRFLDGKSHDSACDLFAERPEAPGLGTSLVEAALLFSQTVLLPPEPPPRPL